MSTQAPGRMTPWPWKFPLWDDWWSLKPDCSGLRLCHCQVCDLVGCPNVTQHLLVAGSEPITHTQSRQGGKADGRQNESTIHHPSHKSSTDVCRLVCKRRLKKQSQSELGNNISTPDSLYALVLWFSSSLSLEPSHTLYFIESIQFEDGHEPHSLAAKEPSSKKSESPSLINNYRLRKPDSAKD